AASRRLDVSGNEVAMLRHSVQELGKELHTAEAKAVQETQACAAATSALAQSQREVKDWQERRKLWLDRQYPRRTETEGSGPPPFSSRPSSSEGSRDSRSSRGSAARPIPVVHQGALKPGDIVMPEETKGPWTSARADLARSSRSSERSFSFYGR
ncbi:hypothetical protein CYMTET_34140, partial [Cymbomonas tetramitiformis]